MAHVLKSYRLPESTVADIERLAEQFGSQSKVIQAGVAELIEKHEPRVVVGEMVGDHMEARFVPESKASSYIPIRSPPASRRIRAKGDKSR